MNLILATDSSKSLEERKEEKIKSLRKKKRQGMLRHGKKP